MLSAVLGHWISESLGKIRSVTPISGGDINRAFRLTTDAGSYFLKSNDAPFSEDMFQREANGLDLLRGVNEIKIPRVIGTFSGREDECCLVLEWMEKAPASQNVMRDFGSQLASLHRHTSPTYGLSDDNYIGSLPQINGDHSSASDFYRDYRLAPQVNLALTKGLLHKSDLKKFERLYSLLDTLIPEEPPALIHGDLWSGNYMITDTGAALIDPAVAYAPREMDLGMSLLFGGFPETFYDAYHESWPLIPGWRDRIPLYQLYYLLVHLNLFGYSYKSGVMRCIDRYL